MSDTVLRSAVRPAERDRARTEQYTRLRQWDAEGRARRREEDAQRREEEARQACKRMESAERNTQTSDDHARHPQEEADEAGRETREAAEHARASTETHSGYMPEKVHIAVAGVSGSGKSTVVNFFRGLSPQDFGAAETGIVETTTTLACYSDPDPCRPILWFDVPGAGTLNVSDWEDYFDDQGLSTFEAILIVFADRFSATKVAILKACKKSSIPAYIVRSKSDQYIRNMMAEVAEDWDEDELRERACQTYAEKTRRNVKDSLAQAGLPDQEVFIISRPALLAAISNMKRPTVQPVVFDEERLVNEVVGNGIMRRLKQKPDEAVMLDRIRRLTRLIII